MTEQDIPSRLMSFFNCKGSITQFIEAKVGHLDVCPLSDNWQTFMKKNEKYYMREIIISHEKKVLWYAKTTISESTYLADKVYFDNLDKTPLGYFLFTSKDVRRIALSYKKLNERADLWGQMKLLFPTIKFSSLWLRQSTFLFFLEKLTIEEIFFPAILDYLS